jgi:hypothetical protein
MTLFYLPLLGGFSDEKKKRRNEGEQGQGGTPGKVKCEPLAGMWALLKSVLT